jgi:predicted membrane channel-forming protein YqfA (hemolysin III family)
MPSTEPVPKPLLRGWSHVVAAVVMTVLGMIVIGVADASATARVWLVVYVVGTVAMFSVSAL